jgi:AsmA family/AsmA-like C-terminal region
VNNLLVAIAVFVITVVGALFAIPYFIDWNSYRSNFEGEASRIVGREVQVDGDVQLHLLPIPYFRLEKVRIADASPDVTFFKADSLSIKLSIPPMLRGIVEANEIEFQRPVVRLALDAKGAWNWQSFAKALASAGYMPSNVTLTSLRITDGVLGLYGPDGTERTKLEGINGELSAPALEGPYRFRGAFVSSGAEREVRLATATPETDGTVRMRASMRLIDTGATYLLDARLADLMGKLRVEGELTARVPIAGFWQPLARGVAVSRKSANTEDEHKLDKSEAAFELKAAVRADAAGAQLQDLSLTFEQDGRPQIITGSMRADWRQEVALDLALASHWLDLDRITAATEDSGPIEGIAKFSTRLRDLIPGQGNARASLIIDQANLGHETIGPVRLSLVRSHEKLEIQELRMGLPGGSHGELQGTLSGPAEAMVFEGSLGLRGTSVARFAAWASGNALPIDPRGDGHFGVRAQLVAGGGVVAARELVGNLSGTTLSGSAHYKWQGRPELAVALEGPRIDARAFVPAGSSLIDMFGFLLGGEAKQDGRSGAKRAWHGAQPDLQLSLRAGQLATTARAYRDAVARIQVKGGQLTDLQLRLAGDGFNLELQGNVADALARAKGSVRGTAAANTANGIGPLMELLGVPAALRPEDDRSQAMVPLRLAGSVTFGGRTPASADLVIDGESNGAAVKLNARFDGGAAGWRSGKADVTATADAADGGKIIALVLAGAAPARAARGQVFIKAAGVPAEGLTTIATLEAGDVGLDFRGRVVAAEAGTSATGDLELRARDGGRLSTLVGLSPPIKLDGTPINGHLKLTMGEGSFKLERMALNIGGRRLAGQLVLAPSGDRRRIEANLDMDDVSVAGLLAPLLDQRLAIAGLAEAAISGRQAWPDEPFSATVLDAFEGNIRLNCKRLTLADGVDLKGAKLGIVLGNGTIDIEEVSGAGLGGQVKAKVLIAKAPAGAEVRGGLRFGALLEAFSAEGPPRANGQVGGVLDFTGRGLSPRAVMSTLQGHGKIQFGEAKLQALWPGAILLAADAGLKAEPDKLAAAVGQRLASGLSAGNLSLAQKTFALEIVDGQLQAKSVTIDTAEGRVSGTASLDLTALTFDSQWRLEAKPVGPPSTAGKQLPAVSVFYRGPVAALGTIEPRIDSSVLEQELSTRKIERDVEELERLRRLDEQRRLQEAERLRKQFETTPPVQPPPSGAPIAPTARPASPG